MKNKFINTALLIILIVCLVGCKSDDACPLHTAANNGGGTGGSISKIYNALGAHPTLGPYESFTLNPDGTAEYLLYLVGLGWTKAVGTYSVDQSTNNITFNLTYDEASSAVVSVCGISFVQTLPYVEVDANTIILPHYAAADGNYVIATVSGLTVPDVSSMPDTCP